jgi:MOSC domain-containing protein YiiM
MKGTVLALFVFPEKKASPLVLSEVRLSQSGLQGDFHSGNNNRRQVLMLSKNVLDEFELSPGTLFENLVVDGIDVMNLSPGQQLQIGDAILEVTVPCDPCVQMDRIRQGLRRALEGKRGMFARVLKPGIIRVGDAVSQP